MAQNKVYPYRHIIGPPIAAPSTGGAAQVRYPLECGHTVTRSASSPVPAKARCETCPPTITIGV